VAAAGVTGGVVTHGGINCSRTDRAVLRAMEVVAGVAVPVARSALLRLVSEDTRAIRQRLVEAVVVRHDDPFG